MNQFVVLEKNPYENVHEYVYRVLHYNLLNMNLHPGMGISEKEISDRLSASRTPIREAFIRLARMGLLEILPQRGTYVSKLSIEQINEFRFLRLTLEEAVMGLACESFPAEFMKRLEECLIKQEKICEKQDCEAFFTLDNEMHSLIFAGCAKSRIWTIVREANVDYIRARVLDLSAVKLEMENLLRQHQGIVQAIRNKDVQRGKKIIHWHVNKVLSDIEKIQKEYPEYFQ